MHLSSRLCALISKCAPPPDHVAFLANAIAPVAPIQLFGIFMALLVLADSILVVTIFPAVVMYHEKHLKHKGKGKDKGGGKD